MVTEWMTRGLGGSGINLSYMFGVLTQANSVTAIIAGVTSEWLVEKTGTLKSSFLAVCAVLPLAAFIIGMTWVGMEFLEQCLFELIITTGGFRPKIMAGFPRYPLGLMQERLSKYFRKAR